MKSISFKKINLSLILLLFSTIQSLSAQDNKIVTGKVTYLNTPLANVNIIIKGTSTGTKTNNKGYYIINAKVGEIINYSYVGLNTMSIIVEDVTSTINIKMTEKVNELNETVVTARKKQRSISQIKKVRGVPIMTAVGMINPDNFPGKSSYFDKNDFIYRYNSFAEFWNSLYSGTDKFITGVGKSSAASRSLPGTWDVDGIIYYSEPPINFNRIIDIHVIEKGATKWGVIGGVVIVRTLDSPQEVAKRKEAKAEKYRNQNYYNDDAITANTEMSFASSKDITTKNKITVSKQVSGKVTYLGKPLVNINIAIVAKITGTKTNAKGEYNLKANVGDIIQYTHLGFATVSIIIEDVTEVLNIEMVLKENELNEVTLTSDGKVGKTLSQAKKREESFTTSRGEINPSRSGFALSFLDGKEISSMYNSLGEALDGKIPGVRYDYVNKLLIVKPISSINTILYPIWDIDGVIYDNEPPTINLDDIIDVRVLKTLAGTNRYGSAGAGGVVWVKTANGDFNPVEAKLKKITEQYTNKDFYANDASQISLESLKSNTYADALEAFNNKQKAYIYYDQTLKNKISNFSDHIAIAQKFVTYYKDINLSTQIFKDLAIHHGKNSEVLKAIAYHFQALGLKRETINLYEAIFKLRPKYAQSYRDLANAYAENDQYKKAWRLYMSYLMQGNDVSGEGIGQILYNEMEFLYYNRRNQTAIKEKFVPKSENLFDFRDDVRFVFEWNTSEAEFNLEFVNADKRAYNFEHNLNVNQELIMDEKQKGYSSKEFFIDDIGIGEWLINITYKGNKKPEPTYFKVTKYYNWGKASQTQDISVYKFQKEREKIQLMQLNKQQLVTSN